MDERRHDLRRFYALLAELEQACRGCRRLSACDGKLRWPERGVYFFFEEGESRSDSGNGPRVVRVGTHALSARARSTLWQRLSAHRGSSGGGGNHRASIFRSLLGVAIARRDGFVAPASWGVAADARTAARGFNMSPEELLRGETALEKAVSAYLGKMRFLWLAVDDAPGPQSERGLIKRHSIALLSNYDRPPLDAPSRLWLGQFSDRERVRRSGLWNSQHIDSSYDPRFLDVLARRIAAAALDGV